jgi:hypothetical protein
MRKEKDTELTKEKPIPFMKAVVDYREPGSTIHHTRLFICSLTYEDKCKIANNLRNCFGINVKNPQRRNK